MISIGKNKKVKTSIEWVSIKENRHVFKISEYLWTAYAVIVAYCLNVVFSALTGMFKMPSNPKIFILLYSIVKIKAYTFLLFVSKN